jgi:phage terminase small subunit
MLVDPIYETAYRSDVRRVETAEKMSIQPFEEFPREEEFNPVTTSYKDLVRIMLQQKFEGLYQDKLQHQNKLYDAHAKKVYEAERARKKQVRFPDHLTRKGIDEVNREIKTDDLRSKRGPFY